MLFKPATPGFLVTLTATILLIVVCFSVPWFKTVYFLRATLDVNGQQGVTTFGVLGYCLNVGGHVNCTSPRLGYEFDPNSLLGNTTPLQIPQVVVKWLTYTFVIHIVALVFAGVSAAFGLLAHIREFSMACCSTCMSGFGASVALLAFIFDIAFFFLLKARINKVPGGSAQTGSAIWLTLVAALLLIFAGCFYGVGRCCISNRPRGLREKRNPSTPGGAELGGGEAMRLDAVKAEADRKARQKQGEVGLPPFHEYDPSRPLTSKYDEEDEPYMDHHDKQASGYSHMEAGGGEYVPKTGYAPAAPGTSAMEAYYNAPAPSQVPPSNNGYAPAAPGTSTMGAYYNAPTPSQVPPSNNGYAPAAPGTSTMDPYYNASTPPQVLPNNGYTPAMLGTSTMDSYYNPPAAPGTSTTGAHYNAQAPPQVPPVEAGYPSQPPTYDQYPSTQYNAYDAPNAQPTHGQYLSSGTYAHGQYASNEAAHGHSAQDTSYYTTASQYQPPLQSNTTWPNEKAD